MIVDQLKVIGVDYPPGTLHFTLPGSFVEEKCGIIYETRNEGPGSVHYFLTSMAQGLSFLLAFMVTSSQLISIIQENLKMMLSSRFMYLS